MNLSTFVALFIFNQLKDTKVIGATSVSNMFNIGLAPTLSMSMVDMGLATSISLQMANAVTAQKNAQAIENTATTQVCNLIISAGFAGAAS
ncbi:MAG: RebB family R body protein [Kangiellaceae bacterium]|nr:RebB family R body protein [Kangiellaceae bacterium]